MSDDRTNVGEDFELLLTWLAPEREAAVERCETIRRNLVKLFAGRGCHNADDLAQDTLIRVASKVKKVVETYGPADDPALYIYGVAKNIHREWLRENSRAPPPPPPPPPEHDEIALACLDECLERLPSEGRELVVEYYRDSGQARIEHRRETARRLEIGMNALRIRACHMRAALRLCVAECIARDATG